MVGVDPDDSTDAVTVTYRNREKLGLGFTVGSCPLRISSIAGASLGHGLAVGMALNSINGLDASHYSYHEAIDILSQQFKLLGTRGSPLELTFCAASAREF